MSSSQTTLLKLAKGWAHTGVLWSIFTLAGCASMTPKVPEQPAETAMTEQEMASLGVEAENRLAAGDRIGAATLYVRITKAYPNNAPAWFRLGIVYLRNEQPAYAQIAFENALRVDPALTKVHANLALAHLYQFRDAAIKAVASPQVPEGNKLALQSLIRDVDHALAPPTADKPASP